MDEKTYIMMNFEYKILIAGSAGYFGDTPGAGQ